MWPWGLHGKRAEDHARSFLINHTSPFWDDQVHAFRRRYRAAIWKIALSEPETLAGTRALSFLCGDSGWPKSSQRARALGEIIERFGGDRVDDTAMAAAGNLGGLGPRGWTEALRLMSHSNPWVRHHTLWAVHQWNKDSIPPGPLASVLIRGLIDEDENVV